MEEKELTLQGRANLKALELGIDPTQSLDETFYEYCPKAPDGVIWWVYTDRREDKFDLSDGWTLMRRKIRVERGEWEDVPATDTDGTAEAVVE